MRSYVSLYFGALLLFAGSVAAGKDSAWSERYFGDPAIEQRYEAALDKSGIKFLKLRTSDNTGWVLKVEKAALEAKAKEPALVEFETWLQRQGQK
jgi:hypothetical protein